MANNLDLVCLFLGVMLLARAMADKSEQNPSPVMVQNEALTPAAASESESNPAAEAPEIRRLGKHHSSDKSVAGGGVIIGGLATALFAAVFCYIRVTRRRDGDDKIGH